jgi:hypothetical protein
MLISVKELSKILLRYGITIKGILHAGAHFCSEIDIYTKFGVDPANILWVDANPTFTDTNITNGIQNCYTAALDETIHDATLNITMNGSRSSILEFGLYAEHARHIFTVESIPVTTQTITQFFQTNSLDPTRYNVWNIDTQGVELQSIRGSKDLLQNVDVVYTCVYKDDAYKGCGKLDEMDVLLAEYGLNRVSSVLYNGYWGEAIYVKGIATELPEEVPVEAPVEAPLETPSEVPVEAPAEVPSEVPVEAPVETPSEVPVEAPVEASSEVPLEAPVEVPVEASLETPSEVPAEVPAEVPTEVPTEAPAEVPIEAPVEAPVEASSEAPAEVPVEAPAEVPAEAPVAAPAEVPTEAPVEVPVEVPVEASSEVPVEAPVETPSEVPVEAPVETPSETPSEVPA